MFVFFEVKMPNDDKSKQLMDQEAKARIMSAEAKRTMEK